MIEPVEDPDFLWHGIITDDESLSYQCFGELEIEPDELNTRWAYPPTKYVRLDLTAQQDNLPTWENWKEILAAGYVQKARADRLEALLREARVDLEHYVCCDYPKHVDTNYEPWWNLEMELCHRIDAELKGEQQ